MSFAARVTRRTGRTAPVPNASARRGPMTTGVPIILYVAGEMIYKGYVDPELGVASLFG